MKYFALLLTFLMPSLVFAQSANFQDDFTDQDISDWTGDTGDFIFVTENDNTLLQQNASEAGTSQLSIPSTNAVGYWDFFIRLDFGPSGSNYSEIYLMSDTQDLDQPLNGYMLQAGEALSGDVFRLFRITAGSKDGEILTGTTDISGGGDYRVRVSRDASGNWALSVANSYSGATVQEATGSDNLYSSTSFFGFKNTYTVGRVEDFFFDFKIQVPPIEITDATVQNANSINLDFNKDYDPATLQNSDFTITSGSVNPTSINQPSSSSVELVFANDIPVGSFDLVITAIEDSNNETTIADTTLALFRFDEYQSGDIIVNEFLKDPPGSLEEYIELKNTSSRLLNLKDWQLGDNGSLSTISNQDFAIQPNSFLVISTDTTAIKNVFGNIALAQVSLPSFNNTTDQVRLYDENGTTIDSLEYTPEWGGDNVAIERRDPSTPSTFIENWGDSPNALGGTAGKENEVATDTTPPDISNLTVTNATTITITYNESVKATNAENLANYSITPSSPALSTASANGDTVTITFASTLQTGINYDIEVSNQEDIFSNSASALTRTFEYIETSVAQSGDVLINEFAYDAPSDLTEFVEITNPTNQVFNLKGWTLSDNTGNTKELTSEDFYLRKSLPDNGGDDNPFTILTPDSTISVSKTNRRIVMGSQFPTLNNSTDAIVLKNAQGVTIDSLTYTDAWGGEEVSLERRSLTTTAQIKENWGDSPNTSGATPAEANEVTADTTPPNIDRISVINATTVAITYSEPVKTSNAENLANYSTNPSSPTLSSVSTNGATVTLTFANVLQAATIYSIVISNQEDLFSNSASTLTRTFEYIDYTPAAINDVIINEFLKDPSNGLPEYVELRNTSSKYINLKDWQLGDNSSLSVLTTQNFVLRPDSFVVISPDTAALKNTFSDVYALQTALPSLNNTTDQIRLFDNNSTLFDSLEYTPEWGGSGVALERRSSTVSSTIQANWGDSPNALGGTPGIENEVAPDTQPPQIENFSVTDNVSVLISYNEPLDSVQAKNTANYSITPSIVVTSVDFNDTEVTLSLGSSLQTEVNYEITISNQEDIFGNILDPQGINVQFINYTTAVINDVIINEFLKDPDNDLPEYVELRNTSSKFINLKGWKIGDNSSINTLTTQDFALRPDSFVVITSDTTTLKNTFGDVYALQSSLPSFNNSTDQVRLFGNNSAIFDSLEYEPDWGGDDVSLERRDPTITSSFRENWGDSPASLTGTPGTANQVLQDTQAPIFQNSFAVNNTRITLVYDERVDETTAENFSNYSFSPSLTLSSITTDRNEVNLNFSTNLQNETTYSITIDNQEDIFGNTLAQTSTSVRYLEFSTSQPLDIVISEFLYQKESESSPEFIELYNRSNKNLDISNWTISDAANNTATLPLGTSLETDSYIVLTDKQDFANSISNGLYLSGFPSLNDLGDGIILKSEAGVTIDSLFYTEKFGGNQDGVSAERKDPSASSNDLNNWNNSSAEGGNSAGAQNSIFQLDTVSPELIFANMLSDGTVYVAFSEFIDPAGATISIDGDSRNILSFDDKNANEIIVDGNGLQASSAVELTVTNLNDVVGNTLSSGSIQVSQPITKGSVVINEILYDPLADSEDNLPDQTEYIELYNTQDYAISLEEIFLNDAPDEDNEVNRLTPISSQFKWIPPKGYFLIFSEDVSSSFEESQLAEYFNIESQSDQFTMQIDRSSLSLSASGDAIFISDSTGSTIDSVFYDESWQNPNRVSVNGVALEKISPTGPSNDGSNWSSSTEVSGGTPNQENSIYQEQPTAPSNTGISFTPNPFSPDDDGFEDFLTISYTLDEPDYLLRIRIYDRYGREVRELADGKSAGFSGNIIWDGLTDNGNKNRVGIYIVLFEAYNSAAGKNRTFKETVVIARKF